MAQGKFAGRYTFTRLAHVSSVRGYSKPSGAPTTNQITARNIMTSVSHNWKTLFTQLVVLSGWTLYARRTDGRLTAANMFIRSVLSLALDMASPAFIFSAFGVGRVLVLHMVNPRTGNASTEQGLFLVRSGQDPDSMLPDGALPIIEGSIIGPVAPAGGTFYYQVFKDGIARSGIMRLDQTQAATYDQAEAASVTWSQLLNAGITWGDLQ